MVVKSGQYTCADIYSRTVLFNFGAGIWTVKIVGHVVSMNIFRYIRPIEFHHHTWTQSVVL